MMKTPFILIQEQLSNKIPIELINNLPQKWEKIGDILILKLDDSFNNYKDEIGEVYCKILNCKTVLNKIGCISGIYRNPNFDIIYGSNNTETIHVENGIRYKLDVKKIMFSSGNMDERIFMGNISNKNEVVVDLFAGIGYFSIPIAVYSIPRKIFSCEIYPTAYNYLCKNIVLNNVSSIVQPLFGDNRKIAPKNIANRVVMGYFENTEDFLPIAFNCLRNKIGIIHYHTICNTEKKPEKSLLDIKKTAEIFNRNADIMSYRKIKSIAPGINHFVLDVKIGE